MKAKFILHITFLLVLVSGVYGCKKHGPAGPTLPPLTHEGKNTFGCLVNGAVYLPKVSLFRSPVSCYYQKLYEGPDGFVFVVQGRFKGNNNCHSSSVTLYLDSIALQIGRTFPLAAYSTGKCEGSYLFTEDCGTTMRTYATKDNANGEVVITGFDDLKGIVSGTFWFDAVDDSGDTIHITQGRFDMQYTN